MPCALCLFANVDMFCSYASVRAHAQARYTVVCVCVCVDCYSCSRINEVQVRISIGFYSHVFVDLQNNASF